MIRVVGIETEDFPQASVEEVIQYFRLKKFTQLDCETYGFDCHKVDMMCLQLGDKQNQFVIHPSKVSELKELIESKVIVGHNLKFDLKFLYKLGVYPNEVYDTFLAEAVLYCGIKLHKKGLAEVARNRIGIDLDKSVRDNIWNEGLTKRVIEYSADDVKYLEDIMEDQGKEAHRKGLTDVIIMENRFVPYLAYIEFCGFKLDDKKWKIKMKHDMVRLEQAEEVLDEILRNSGLPEYVDIQGNLFGAPKGGKINWSSSRQVVKLFKRLGIKVEVVVKGKTKESVEAPVIIKQQGAFPIITAYLEFKKAEKIVTTYGQTFIDQINPSTGRLHTQFRQVMDTGRLSSGGKNRATKEEYINFQNIPKDDGTRHCFIPEEGNVLVVGDYSGQEQIVLANMAMDQGLLEFYDKGYGDMHSFVAQKMYPEISTLTLQEVKELHSDKRQKAKSVGFSINYGGAGSTIANDIGCSLEEGNYIYNAYFTAFPGLREYFEQVKKEGLARGYILISPITQRKSYVDGYERMRELEKVFNRDYWLKYRAEKLKWEKGQDSIFLNMKERVSEYFKLKGGIERKALNYPIQGQSAEITKMSGVLFYEWIRSQGYWGVVKAVNQVHDENVIECPRGMAIEVRDALADCMVRAGKVYCKRVALKVDPVIVERWEK